MSIRDVIHLRPIVVDGVLLKHFNPQGKICTLLTLSLSNPPSRFKCFLNLSLSVPCLGLTDQGRVKEVP